MEYRQIIYEDRDELIHLCVALEFRRIKEKSPEQLKIRFDKLIKEIVNSENISTFIAKEQDQIVGFVSVHWLPYLILGGSEGYISELFVLENFRGKSIGHHLLELVEKEAHNRDCVRLSLLNSRVRESYERKFYKKLEFYERQEFANFVKNF